MDVTLETRRKQVNWTKILLLITTILAVVFFLKPGIQGYSVYLQAKNSNYSLEELGQNIQTLQHKLDLSEQNLSMQNTLTGNVIQLVEKSNIELTTCLTEKAKLQAENTYTTELCDQRVKLLQQKINEDAAAQAAQTSESVTKAQEDLKLIQGQLERTLSDFNSFTENTARSVCCKQKFDNPNINSYSIINHKLVCLENSGTPLACSLG
ncbi:hypothetical protein HY496_01875 [Candidatus Woesearchaeota archaeon]|nr:hypothetical protein [Candidatus Woesearchaeota archaeon]